MVLEYSLIGRQHSVSNDPNVSPAINPRYFSRKSGMFLILTLLLSHWLRTIDLNVLVEMVKFNRKLATTAPLTEVFGLYPSSSSSDAMLRLKPLPSIQVPLPRRSIPVPTFKRTKRLQVSQA